jgi:hypothetical protein
MSHFDMSVRHRGDVRVDTEIVEGFAIDVWARRSRVEASKAGILLLSDDDVARRLDAARSGGLAVLERDELSASGWVSRTLTEFSPGQRKCDVLARVGEHDWTPVPVLLEKLEAARKRGEDVLGMPAVRAEASLEFEVRQPKRRRTASDDADDSRGRSTGRVEAGPDAVVRPEGYWKELAEFLARLPVEAAPDSVL